MPALGAPELIIILVIIVLIFGVGKLPEVGSALGKGIKEFKVNSDDKDEVLATGSTTSATSASSTGRPQEERIIERREVRADEI